MPRQVAQEWYPSCELVDTDDGTATKKIFSFFKAGTVKIKSGRLVQKHSCMTESDQSKMLLHWTPDKQPP